MQTNALKEGVHLDSQDASWNTVVKQFSWQSSIPEGLNREEVASGWRKVCKKYNNNCNI